MRLHHIYLFQLRSSAFNPCDLIIRFLNIFAHVLPEIPFHCKINTCNVSFKAPNVPIKSDKSSIKSNNTLT